VPPLHPNLRRQLEAAVIKARDIAEAGARVALQALAVEQREPFRHMSADLRQLRIRLRAKARQLGNGRHNDGKQDIDHLVVECAYEHWHRMLFARFLAENSLLMHPEGVAVTLKECKELAESEGAADEWELAGRYAARMLPQIFRPDDPALQVQFAPEHKVGLEKLLAGLPPEVFTADDGLGWVYQFWQSKRKDEVNASGRKIGADELPAVTQLFTEHYMVLFLLHNTIGAWWAGKYLAEHPDVAADASLTENDLRRKVALGGCEFEYLRFVRAAEREGGAEAWRPAAGTFPGWPVKAAELKILDPCCGSGHFLVAAFELMVRLRMREEGLPARDACDAVLRDNIHGLEIDERCCQIAAFALAMAAWRYAGAGGYRILPELHIACTGIGPQATEEQWLKLAEQSGIRMPAHGRDAIKNGLLNLHRLFSQAPTLGSLINPLELPGDLIAADYETIQPYLAAALSAEASDDETHERVVAAAGMVKAAELLAGEYTLVITNVPYLEQRKHDTVLKDFCAVHHSNAKSELATVFLRRATQFCTSGGSTAVVTPQNWLFLTTYHRFRVMLLDTHTWQMVARLGPGAFETISGHVVKAAMLILTHEVPDDGTSVYGIDVSAVMDSAQSKAKSLRQYSLDRSAQASILENPDARVFFGRQIAEKSLGDYALCLAGIMNGDSPRFLRCFWEIDDRKELWAFQQTTVDKIVEFGGCHNLIYYDEVDGHLRERADVRRQKLHNSDERGNQAWGRRGVAVSQIGDLPVALYSGHKFDSNVAVIVPHDGAHLPAVWAFCRSGEFREAVRLLDSKLNVTNATFAKVPFDLQLWQSTADQEEPIPAPFSNEPTEFIFQGNIRETTDPLHVAAARLLGYAWPEQVRDSAARFVDRDGIVCLPSSRGERPAADRLRDLLAAAYGADWSPAKEAELLEQAGFGGKNLDDWLRDGFFEQHCKLFHHRPFVWHIWDGRRRDGFHALVNYHKLCGSGFQPLSQETRQDAESIPAAGSRSHPGRKLLETLTYAHVGDWIKLQKEDVDRGRSGAEARLIAAQELQKKLELILAGEKPHDIFVRWKPIQQQPIGWEPDLNDGVRLNIRPFMTAGVLRKDPNINWKKDRGTDPKSAPWYGVFKGERINDFHLTLAEKQKARSESGKQE